MLAEGEPVFFALFAIFALLVIIGILQNQGFIPYI